MFERAARMVDNSGYACCLAIVEVNSLGFYRASHRPYIDMLYEYFYPGNGEAYWWGYPYSRIAQVNERRKFQRIMALTILAEIVKDQNRKHQ